MVPDFGRRTPATGAAFCITLVMVVVGCGDAVKTPFFDGGTSSQGGGGATPQGGASGTGTGGSNGGSVSGGDAGVGGSATGGATGGDAGMAGTAGNAGLGATGGTGSGGSAGVATGGMSGTDPGGMGGTGGGIVVDCGALDADAVAFDGHCYVHRTTARTWMDARDDCDADDAHLVTLSSEGRSEAEFAAENAFVWTLGGASEVWIGATDGRQSNQSGNGTPYTWITGELMTFDLWSSGQPNNSQSACMDNAPCTCGDMCWEHCGFMWDPDNDEPGTWNDRHCEHLIGYVCEWDDPPM